MSSASTPPPWQEHRVLAEAIGEAYAEGCKATLGSTADLGKVASFHPEEMLSGRAMPVHASVVRFGAPLRDVAIVLASHKEDVTNQLAIAGAEHVLQTFELACDIELVDTAVYDDAITAIEQCDALWLEATYHIELPIGEARLIIGTGLLESVSCYVNGVSDPYAEQGVASDDAPHEVDAEALAASILGEDTPAASAGIDDFDAMLAEQERAEAMAAAILADAAEASAINLAAIAASSTAATTAAPAGVPNIAPTAAEESHALNVEHWSSLLSGVEVELSAELGSTDLTLGDITSLVAESVLTLDQLVDDPVTVCVNGTRYATARLVVVDGEYGIEILEVVEQPAFLPGTLAA